MIKNWIAVIALSWAWAVPAQAQTATTFTYQGRLNVNNSVATGNYDFTFTLYDAALGGNLVSGPLTNSAMAVSSGLFTAALDFGPAVFPGTPRWLEIGVRQSGSSTFFRALTPRQALTPAPYSIWANTVADGAISASKLSAGSGANSQVLTLNGGALSWSTIVPNSLAAATWLALTNQAAALTGNATNLTLCTTNVPTLALRWTNTATSDFFGSNTPLGLLNFDTKTNPIALLFGGGTYGSLFINTGHGGSSATPNNTEWQFTSPGNFAFGPGFGVNGQGHFQWGIGTGNYWSYFQDGSKSGSVPGTLGVTFPLTWKTGWNSNGTYSTRFPGILTRALSTNGDWALDIFGHLGNDYTWDRWKDADIAAPGLRLFFGRKPGAQMPGYLIQERRAANVSTASYALDFSLAQCVDLTLATDTVSFYTINATGAPTNYERRVFVIRSGALSTSLSWPAGWSVLGAPGTASLGVLPATMPPGQLIRLQLESVGPGESNIIASAQLARDSTFVDANVQAFVVAAAIGDPKVIAALQIFVTTLKADGTWNLFTNGAIYPFAAGTPQGNTLNLVNPKTYRISWGGSVNHSSAGISGDGASGYGDTHWTNSSLNSVSLFAYLKGNYAATYAYPMGADDGTNVLAYRHSGQTDRFQGGVDCDSSIALGAGPLNFPNAVMASRTSATLQNWYQDYGVMATDSTISTEVPKLSVFLLARNYAGGANNFWGDTLQVCALGAGCSQAQYQTLYSATTNLNAALGR